MCKRYKEREKKMLQTKANNKFGTLTKRTKKVEDKEFNIEDYNYLAQKDKRMRFNTSKDPIYYVFDVIENRPISTLAKEFVKDSFFEAVNFVSQVVR